MLLSAIVSAFLVAHTSAVEVVTTSSSRFWYNYRHAADAMAFGDIAKDLGVGEMNMIRVTFENYACDARNCYNGKMRMLDSAMVSDSDGGMEMIDRRYFLNTDSVLYDYTGEQTTRLQDFRRLLSGRHKPFTPWNKRLAGLHPLAPQSIKTQTLVFYLNGHGGNGYFKFGDFEEIQSHTIIGDLMTSLGADDMKEKKILWIIDSCEASSLTEKFTKPNFVVLSSSDATEKSYSVGEDSENLVSQADRLTSALHAHHVEGQLEGLNIRKLGELLNTRHLASTATIYHTELSTDLEDWVLSDLLRGTDEDKFIELPRMIQ